MGKFDRYLLSQFLVMFGFFSLVLVLVYWINRAVRLFDQLIASGQSAMVVVEFTLLTLPGVVLIMMPLSAFAGVVYVTNRLQSESELVVMQAVGYSPWRLARPVLIFGLLVGALTSVLTHFLVPASLAELSKKRVEIADDVTAGLLTEGVFLHPAPGITFYIGEISPEGEVKNLFLSDARRADRRSTYTAQRAVVARDDTGPKIVMFDGMVQTYDRTTRQLTTTNFDNFTYDLGALIPISQIQRPLPRELPTSVLLAPTDEQVEATRGSRAAMIYEGHLRFSRALMTVLAPLVGFSILMLGGFSRFGMWRQIVAAIFAILLIDTLDKSAARIVRSDADTWPLTYAAALAGFAAIALILWIATRQMRRRGRGDPGTGGEVPA